MTAVGPIFPQPTSLGVKELVLAENQPEYDPLPCAFVMDSRVPVLCRFRLSPEDLAAVLEGADIVIQQLTFGQPYHPVAVSVVPQEQNPWVAQ